MMLNSSVGISSSKTRVVLVLQAEQALWFKWLDDELLDSFVEPLSTHPLKIGTHCPWLPTKQNFGGFQIELILDTALDELDKVKSDVAAFSGFQVLKRWQLERRMQQDFPHAEIHTVPNYMAPDVLSIHHQVIPDAWTSWLQRLQEDHVVVTHVVTATELLTRLQHVLDGPVLITMPVGAESRHLLIDNRTPLFMRMASANNEKVAHAPIDSELAHGSLSDEATVELNNTLEYVSNTVLKNGQSVLVMTPSDDKSASTEVVKSAHILARLCVNLPVEFSIRHWHKGVLTQRPLRSALARLPVGDWFVLRFMRQLFELVPWPLPNLESSSLNPHFSVTGERQKSIQALVSSVNSSVLRQRINALRNATVLCALMATLTVVLAGTHGLHSIRERVQLVSDNTLLEGKITPLSVAVSTLHDSPEFAVRSLQRIRAHQAIKPLEPQILLSTVASAITDFPSLVLDSLSWSVIDEGDAVYDDVGINSRMIGRESLWTTDTPRSQIQIDLSGVVSGKQGLREQQKAVKSFVAYLEAVEGISRVSVLESPAQAARSSQVLVGTGARYRVSLVLGTS